MNLNHNPLPPTGTILNTDFSMLLLLQVALSNTSASFFLTHHSCDTTRYLSKFPFPSTLGLATTFKIL